MIQKGYDKIKCELLYKEVHKFSTKYPDTNDGGRLNILMFLKFELYTLIPSHLSVPGRRPVGSKGRQDKTVIDRIVY